MTEKKRPLNFAIDPRRDDPTRSFAQGDLNGGASKKMSRKIALLYVLFPIIGAICVLFYFTYLDITAKLGNVNVEGNRNVQSVSKEFKNKIIALEDRYGKLQKSIGEENKKRDAAFTAYQTSANDQSQKLSTALSEIKSDLEKNVTESKSTYMEKTFVTEPLNKINGEIKTLSDNVDQATRQLSVFKEDMAREWSAMKIQVKDIRNDLILAQADISSLATDKAAKKALRTTLAGAKKSLQTALDKNVSVLNGKISLIQNKIKILNKAEGRLRRLEKDMAPLNAIQKRLNSLETDKDKIDAIQSEIYFQKQETAKILEILRPAYPAILGGQPVEIIESDLEP